MTIPVFLQTAGLLARSNVFMTLSRSTERNACRVSQNGYQSQRKQADSGTDESGYHRRSLSENRMYRFKQLGDKIFSRVFDCQVAEAQVRAAIINRFTYLGTPKFPEL